jgi:hypothetical protein
LRILGRASAQVNAEQAFTFAARAGKGLKIVSIKTVDGKPSRLFGSLIRQRSIQETDAGPYRILVGAKKGGRGEENRSPFRSRLGRLQ